MPTRELYVQGTQGQPLGIEPPHWTTEDYRSRHWAVYVSYHLSRFVTWWGCPWGGVALWGGGGGCSKGGLRLSIPVGTGLVMVSARATHNIQGLW